MPLGPQYRETEQYFCETLGTFILEAVIAIGQKEFSQKDRKLWGFKVTCYTQVSPNNTFLMMLMVINGTIEYIFFRLLMPLMVAEVGRRL